MDELTPDQCRALKGKGRKYRNQPVVVGGVYWHSKGEQQRWVSLVLHQEAGIITDLERQKKMPLHAPDGTLIGHLVIDFFYREDGRWVAEDYKGMLTPLAKWKLKHAQAEYPDVEVRVTRRKQ